ncbi:MAG: DUF59 domain-containing protein [Verrucomicrobia bacterium]|nr:DUF59 domain-containing protein [Verrucomicrobiota bacterium]
MATLHSLAHECPATLIPSGELLSLPAGTEVQIVQHLGGSVTVRTERGLVRISRQHAGAIAGFTPAEEGSRGEPPAEFNEEAVWNALRTCYDPEIPVNIVDLGLIYDLVVEATADGGHTVEVKMTLTAPGCGMGPVIAEDARQKIAQLPTVKSAHVHIVWDPQWSPQMISESGRKVLGLE